ncbi:MAG: lactate utilization protein [Candidatus Omnitrophota bacterium]
MEPKIDSLIKIWHKRNIKGLYCANKDDAALKLLEIIPQAASIGFSGSVTIDQLGIIKRIEERGNKIFNPYLAGISRDESLALRKKGALDADYYLASANAVAETGELVFLSALGNRTAGVSYAKNAIIVCGVNKLTANLDDAFKRAREYATPLNYKRLNWNPDKIMCCQVLVIEAEVTPDRLKVILVGESLGF